MIRIATQKDIPALLRLLSQVLTVHANGRPDVFKAGQTKYTREELLDILQNEKTPVYVATDETDTALGYVFCQYHEIVDDNILQNVKYVYIDDLCVDEACRGQRLGTALYEFVVEKAKEMHFDSIRLNVWALNETALHFYKKLGLTPLKTTMEKKI